MSLDGTASEVAMHNAIQAALGSTEATRLVTVQDVANVNLAREAVRIDQSSP